MRRKDCKRESLIGEEKGIFLKRKDTILRGKKGTIIFIQQNLFSRKKFLRNLQEKNNQLSFAPRIPTKTGIKSKSLKEIRGL